MTIDDAIMKAIAAGYRDFAGSPVEKTFEEGGWPAIKYWATENSAMIKVPALVDEHPFLDPSFWQSLGKAME